MAVNGSLYQYFHRVQVFPPLRSPASEVSASFVLQKPKIVGIMSKLLAYSSTDRPVGGKLIQ